MPWDFLGEAPTRLRESQEALSRSDFPPIEDHCHRLASDAGWLGAREFQKLASRGEVLAMERQPEQVAAVLSELQTLLAPLLERLPQVEQALAEGRDPCESE